MGSVDSPWPAPSSICCPPRTWCTSATPAGIPTGRAHRPRSASSPVQLAWSLVKQHDVKAVVVACNTASAAALDVLQQELPVLVVDVVEPGARALVKASTSGRVGVIGTVGAIGSGAYERAVAATGADVELTRPRARVSSSSSSAARRRATRSRSWPSDCWRRSRRPTSMLCCSAARTIHIWRE